MALIGMAVYSTLENGKDEYLEKTLDSLYSTVKFHLNPEHRLILSVNAFTPRTLKIFKEFQVHGVISKIIFNNSNIGTAEALNKAWKERLPGENCVKMDDDVVIHSKNWLYLMEEAIRRDPKIGQIGLKRRDCLESPSTPGFYGSKLRMLPHTPGEVWITVEDVNHVMGTCVMHSSALLDTIGYLWQPGLYGFDDSFMSLRSQLAGFTNSFLTAVDIEHIDRGDTGYQRWKEQKAGEKWEAYKKAHTEFSTSKRPLYYNPFESKNNG
jgi:GT2 family glycosyltransferase